MGSGRCRRMPGSAAGSRCWCRPTTRRRRIGRLLASTRALEYPAGRYEVYVVADNCADRTAEVARAAGAVVEERFDQVSRGKGYALRWLLTRLRERGARYDAYVVIDADTIVAPDLLRRLDAHFEAGSQVVQVYYTVLNVGESPVAALRFAALAAVHYLRPLGRARLGLSCGLKGNGMAFLAPVLDRYGWEWFTLAEDVELHLALVRGRLEGRLRAGDDGAGRHAGHVRAGREPERALGARSAGDAAPARPGALAGRPEPARSGPGGRRGGAADPADLGAGRAGRGGARRAACSSGRAWPPCWPGSAWAGSLDTSWPGWRWSRAPWRVYRALAYAPGYIGWKVWLYGRSLGARGAAPWVRTERVPSPLALPRDR